MVKLLHVGLLPRRSLCS